MIDLAEYSRHTQRYLRFWLPLGKLVCMPLFWLLGPVRTRGTYRIPKSGPVLIVSNHQADVDPVVIQAICPRPMHFMAKSELFEGRLMGRLQRAFGSFPVRRGVADRAAIKHAVTLLKAGEVVGVFPEGQLTEDGEIQEIKGGIAIIIRLAPETPVICCGLNGTNRIMPYGKTTPRPAFHRVDVTLGEPRVFGPDSTPEEILAWIAGQLRELTRIDPK